MSCSISAQVLKPNQPLNWKKNSESSKRMEQICKNSDGENFYSKKWKNFSFGSPKIGKTWIFLGHQTSTGREFQEIKHCTKTKWDKIYNSESIFCLPTPKRGIFGSFLRTTPMHWSSQCFRLSNSLNKPRIRICSALEQAGYWKTFKNCHKYSVLLYSNNNLFRTADDRKQKSWLHYKLATTAQASPSNHSNG